MSGTSSEYQRGYDDGLAFPGRPSELMRARMEGYLQGRADAFREVAASDEVDPVSLADARAESYRKGWADALSRLLGAAEVQAASESGIGDREFWEDVARIIRTASPDSPTAPQASSHLPTPPEAPEPATAQHSGSHAFQENDDGA